ncbi:ATP synthase subunit d, mitochondrial [Vanrija pseudolonga]|uniref:ATP synthase subunit d, mitochondrial n=1 Tax=Vanrija pseudolonga TaxID=143232 RepID=A0AAF1BQU0_9TREE|nr:ATP synthase subunit d, mitochondrial [Vanrija pseudolonga]
MSAIRSASANVDWSKIYSGLGLNKETLTELQAFRARNTAAFNKAAAIKATVPELDLAHYKSVLKDQSVIQQAEKVLAEFKPADYDVSKWNGVVDAFEGKAVEAAKATVTKISSEEESLKKTLSNIQDARPFEDLTAAEVGHARPEITHAVETMLKKGKWTVPGYRETFGEFSLM